MARTFHYGPDLDSDEHTIALALLDGVSVSFVVSDVDPPFEARFQLEDIKHFAAVARCVIADIEDCGSIPYAESDGEVGSAFVHEHEEIAGIVVVSFMSANGGLVLNFTQEQFQRFEIYISGFWNAELG